MDFVIKQMPAELWESYKKTYPYMLYGTHIYDRTKDGLTIFTRRFIDIETCRRYCTAPTQSDLSGGKGPL